MPPDSAVDTLSSAPGGSLRDTRHDWTVDEVLSLFDAPLSDLLHRAQNVHRAHFDPNRVQLSTLLNIKTGACPEDCAYCPQSARYHTGLEAEKLMEVEHVVEAAHAARRHGATRFCMGAAWRSPKDRDLEKVAAMVEAVRDLGMETCVTLGMLSDRQTERLRQAGLDYYNHNIDTSPGFYGEIITTRRFQDRLDTLARVRDAGIKVCCGGIVGMGESRADRASMLAVLANLPEHPQSVPVNQLVPVPGTPLGDTEAVDPFELVRTVAAARIMMPRSWVRLSAGRQSMHDAVQALCFLAGANSIFYGERLLTTGNASVDHDRELFRRLGIRPDGEAVAGPEIA